MCKAIETNVFHQMCEVLVLQSSTEFHGETFLFILENIVAPRLREILNTLVLETGSQYVGLVG